MFLIFLGIVLFTVGALSLFFNIMASSMAYSLMGAGIFLIVIGRILLSTTTKKRAAKRMRRMAAARRKRMVGQRKMARETGQLARAQASGAQVVRPRISYKSGAEIFQENTARILIKLAEIIQGKQVIERRLEKVKQLFNDGLISQTEYDEKRKSIISKL